MSGADGIRTHYLFSAIEALSQLSYGPLNVASVYSIARGLSNRHHWLYPTARGDALKLLLHPPKTVL